ncbi:gamma-tubulin complex component protein [Gongronella butleri]|nr:gamma-tubulin complex component protein [Gongronella butleri]
MSIDVPESALLRDLIYILQGIDGQYIRFDPATSEYHFDPNVNVSPPTQNLIYRLTELGWLYQRIQAFIHSNMNKMAMGLVGQSFCSALQSELMDYYKLIAILEAQIEKQDVSDEFIPNEQSLTLKRLLVWTQESQQRLKLMDILVEISRDRKGGALVSAIHDYTNHGDPFFKQFITEMLQRVSKPFYDMLRRWITEGELDDPFEEFFVATDPTVSEEELWQRKYTIRENMLPSFISNDLAQKIFSIGKSLNFIRYSCHDETLVDKYYAQNSSTLPLGDFKYGDMQTIEQCVDAMYTETSDRLLSLLKDKYHLMDHLDALKRYLFLGQGDFIQYLMATLGPALSRPASTLFRHNLTGVLETAIRASNAQYDDPAMLNRLDVRLLEISPQDLGWDVFTLDYHVDSPINTVLSPPAMNQYLRIFNFLWRLKRVEYTLTATWRRWGTASRSFTRIPDLGQDLHKAQLIIARMVHFIYQLQHYYLFEVLESSWEKLYSSIHGNSMDLDAVIAAHHQYLQDITQKGFLAAAGQHQPLSIELDSIFDIILTYKTILDMLYGYGTAQLAAQNKGSSRFADQKDKLVIIRGKLEDVTEKFKVQTQQFLDHTRDMGLHIIK